MENIKLELETPLKVRDRSIPDLASISTLISVLA